MKRFLILPLVFFLLTHSSDLAAEKLDELNQSSVQESGHVQIQVVKDRLNQEAIQGDEKALLFVQEKFQTNGSTAPEWFLKSYPAPSQMNQLPGIAGTSSAGTGSLGNLPAANQAQAGSVVVPNGGTQNYLRVQGQTLDSVLPVSIKFWDTCPMKLILASWRV